MEEAGNDWGDSPEDCPVCMTSFDDSVHRPRTLPCGHTLCTLCTDELKKNGRGRVTCAMCRASHAMPKRGDFPVCYIIEALVKRMRDAEARATSAATALHPHFGGKRKEVEGATGQNRVEGFSKKTCSFLQEQVNSVVAAIIACQEARSQLEQYRTTLTYWGEQQQQLEGRLQALVNQSKGARERLRLEESCAWAKEEEVMKKEQELQAVRETLQAPATGREVGAAASGVFSCLKEVEKCQECFPDVRNVTEARKVREASIAALEAAWAVHVTLKTPAPGTAKKPQPQPAPDSTITERFQLILGVSLTTEDLRSQTQATLRLLQGGRVFAIQQVEGQHRYAKMSLETGRLYLHVLKEQSPPEGSSILQMSEFVPPCTVFLDLSWPGRSPRRVKVCLSHDTPRSRQFLMLCTGQRGPSYINTSLFRVYNKGVPGECVLGGDYEMMDGNGSCLLLPGLDTGEYEWSVRAGAVYGREWDDPAWGECGQFGISTRDCELGDVRTRVFGEVVDGLNVVAEAAQHSNIMEVTVVDCGLVL